MDADTRLAEIAESHPGDWYSGEWRTKYVDSTSDEPSYYVVEHQESETVLAELPDWAGPIALFIADAHEAVPDLLAEVNRLRARVTELETAQTAFLLPWAHQLDAKSLDNFVGDLVRAADAPLMFVVDEIHQTVAHWRELVAKKAAEDDVKADVA